MIEDWIPGVLCRSQVQHLSDKGYLLNIEASAIDHSAVDLHITGDGYHLPGGSVKPAFGIHYGTEIKAVGHPLLLDETGTITLKGKNTYVFRLKERLNLRSVDLPPFYGQATAKSSVGRVDVLARLIVDGMGDYESFDPNGLKKGSGDLYLEVTPITFDVVVRPGISLTQLRFFLGDPHDVEIRASELYGAVLKNTSARDGTLSVDLTPVEKGGIPTSTFLARAGENAKPVPLWKGEQRPDPWGYWRFRCAERQDSHLRLRIEEGNFYILRSKERIALPGSVAVYCRASDETIGEMRIHYAGFVHPLFGRRHGSSEVGTPLIFEVRGRDVNVSLRDGERMARLIFYRMSEDAKPTEEDEKADQQVYEGQNLQLSKFFAEWPERLKYADEASGQVEPE
jgi:dCTP deaminase